MSELAFADARDLLERYRRRDVSPREVLAACRQAYEDRNGDINAIIAPRWEGAVRDAEDAERRIASGEIRPLEGVPFAVKDNLDVAGLPTTFGTRAVDHTPAGADSVHVARLRAAGAIVVGKTNTPELAASINTRNELFGPTRCPWDLSRSAGGSSGGSAAAVASGMCVLADGTDHGGSVRIPAAVNGIVGLRPTPGRVPLAPSPWLFDAFAVVGTLTRSVADAALMLSVMAGPDPDLPVSAAPGHEPRSAGTERWRVAWSPDLGGLFPVEPEVAHIAAGAMDVLRGLGCTVDETAPDLREVPGVIRILRTVRAEITLLGRDIRREELTTEALRRSAERAAAVSGLEVAHAERARSVLAERLASLFRRYEILALPATQWPAFPIEQEAPALIDGKPAADMLDAIMATYAFSVLGVPAISVPCGFTGGGLPVGLQLVAPWRDEGRLLRIAQAYEAATSWSTRRPTR